MQDFCLNKLRPLQVAWLLLHGASSAEEPKLRCNIMQGGTGQLLEASMVDNPYTVRAIDINDRFRFKPVVVGKDGQVDHIKLYTYYRIGGKAILLHQAKHFPPKLHPDSEISLGTHYVYSPLYEREMQYSCVLYRKGQ